MTHEIKTKKENKFDTSPFQVDWLTLNTSDCQQKIGICSLPGCCFKDSWRDINFDIECLKQDGVQDIFCLCTNGEFYRYRTKDILDKYRESGFSVHHYPIEDGNVPAFDEVIQIIEDISVCLKAMRKTIIHCYGGFGRSCTIVACLLMALDDTISHEEAARKLKELKGNRAINSVKQYNFVTEFPTLFSEYKQK
ncbi:cyclin-dependent kinase inhibitor 3 [Biomphalaria glabrata]|uniref:protein-tyrosine-phosphatase n=1 Tax=Biomphalaria glabrata TaxID=6526 RepID=A0A2C9LV13_BIOGL|nr:cyclin-dependent kinase inhibitor 3-like [Biomphalaria glabrata]XP_055879971.1 cyclin-dependent kinase inhibitor 3-like [Biomphalaria glabrata]XP_055879972.1 cyclin-dependent kinase inhibitor 3-like [Biomphalaria glabrata]XP_055879973.1 cyclin-dependent kinase inhibitor 3-like [Biomphalaria glabrata]KAI8735088.1 cyclin-dependent kinase inhibitor 3-like [Biomphalaria glabrata]KAI8784350.1 cyclin-dependent kinase inhibitor 3 [Biomphalaria glabrata]